MTRKLTLALTILLLAGTPAAGQSWRTEDVSRQRRGEERLDVKIRYAVGRFEVRPISDGTLYRIQSRYDEEMFDLYSNYRLSDGRGRLRIDLEGRDEIEIGNIGDYEEKAGRLELEISDATPVSLNFELGAVEAVLELGGLRLNELRLATGASDMTVRFSKRNPEVAERCEFKVGAARLQVELLGNSGCRALTFHSGVGTVTLDFSGAWGHDARCDIKVGLGSIEIRVPEELGVRIERSTIFMSFEAPGFWKGDDAWVSQNWSEAENRLELNVSGALGSIKVVRI